MKVLLFAVFVLIPWNASGQVTSRDLTAAERKLVATPLARGFKDPGSVQFRFTKAVEMSPNGLAIVCGEANGRNSYGGYSGFQPFVAGLPMKAGKIIGGVLIATGSYDSPDGKAAQMTCEDKGLDARRSR